MVIRAVRLALLAFMCSCFAVRIPSDGKLIVAYTDWGQCDDKVVVAAQNGVNVVIWMAINLQMNGTAPNINGQQDHNYDCIANISMTLQKMGLPTTHLVSIGGWDAPHPDTLLTGGEWWTAWKQWNTDVVARPAMNFSGFDGIDWDIEGEDNLAGANNIMPFAMLNLVGEMSESAQRDGYSVSITPCESYLDIYNPYFDLNLTHAYTEWPLFPYHGHNPYAYLVAKYIAAFDIITVQLYESWTHANYQISVVQVPASAYLEMWGRQITFGWEVYFSNYAGTDIPSQWVKVPSSKLVWGFANAWTGNINRSVITKALYVEPTEIASAFEKLNATDEGSPRGVMFWDISSEGLPLNGSSTPIWFAKEMNNFLQVRTST